MSIHANGRLPSNTSVKVYSGDRLLAAATGSLWLEDNPRHGALTMPRNPNWLGFSHLTLDTAEGAHYSIVPTRIEQGAGALPMLIFELE